MRVASPWGLRLFRDKRQPERLAQARGGLARYLLIVLLPLAFLPLALLSGLAFFQARNSIENQVNAQLTSIASLKELQITQWVAARRGDINNLAVAPDVLEATRTFLSAPATEANPSVLQQRLNTFVFENPDFTGVFFATDTGQVLLATNTLQGLIGESVLDEPYFNLARQDAQVASPRFDPRLNPTAITVVAAAPVFDPGQGSIAVLVGVIQDSQLRAIIAPIGPVLGSTGRAYALTGEGDEIGRPITAQVTKPTSTGIQTVMQRQNGSGQYSDPNGQVVFGVYRWLSSFGLAILVEQQVVEAFQPITEFATIVLIIAAITGLASVIVVLLFTRSLTRPIQTLTDRAQQLASGELAVRVSIQRDDELGLLAEAFNQMAAQLSDLYQGLEERVAERTHQLATAAEVARAATATLQTDELLIRAVELIQERFGYYQVSIFLIDESGRYAVMQEAVGPGSALKASGYQLPVGSQSLIGWVTANKKPRTVADVSDDVFYLKNELLPETRSEAAIPLRLGERVLGALDVQSREANAFSESELQVLQILADQIAVGVENGRLFSRQSQVVRLEKLLSDLTGKIHQTRRIESILENTATELGRALGAQRVVVRLRPTSQASVPASASAEGPANGHSTSATETPTLVVTPEPPPAPPPPRRRAPSNLLDKL